MALRLSILIGEETGTYSTGLGIQWAGGGREPDSGSEQLLRGTHGNRSSLPDRDTWSAVNPVVNKRS